MKKDSVLKAPGITRWHREDAQSVVAVIPEARLQGEVALTGAFQAWGVRS